LIDAESFGDYDPERTMVGSVTSGTCCPGEREPFKLFCVYDIGTYIVRSVLSVSTIETSTGDLSLLEN
jgi:hypothetical protein